MLTQPINIYIVDDHKIFREGVSSLINLEDDMQVVGSKGSLAEMQEEILSIRPDLVLMDLSIGSDYGVDGINWLKTSDLDAKVLVLSMHRESKHIKKVLDAGANGYILKDSGTDEMLAAIKKVHQGATFYSQDIMSTIVRQLTQEDNKPKWGAVSQVLSKRETEVLTLIAQEKSNQEIADDLFISIRTVDTHRRNIMDKLDAKNTASLVRYAIKTGMVEL